MIEVTIDELDKRIADASKAASEARIKTTLILLKTRLLIMGLTLKTEDYEKYKNLEARIKELEGDG